MLQPEKLPYPKEAPRGFIRPSRLLPTPWHPTLDSVRHTNVINFLFLNTLVKM